MPKKYNISKKSDLKRLEKDLTAKINAIAEKKILSGEYQVKCPHCHETITVSRYTNYCPVCYHHIVLKFNFAKK